MAPNKRDIGLLIIGDEILSGKRQDKHLQQSLSLLKPRGLALSWVRLLGDDPRLLTQSLEQTFASDAIVFSFGGIGATPDDRTRQCAAKALSLPLVRHPQAVQEIEAQFGEQAYPQRIHMAEYPQGSDIIPNFYNRVPGFSIRDHHFMPGFPMMAKPMMEWVLMNHYDGLQFAPTVECAIRMFDAQESDWIEFMQGFERRFPTLRLFSLPKIDEDDRRSIELGVEGLPDEAESGLTQIINEANLRGQEWERVS
jgi:molybdopterin-biosynthesis enzyme MoeA-like protein